MAKNNQTPSKKTTSKKAPAKKAAKKASVKKATVKKQAAKKAPVKKAPAKKTAIKSTKSKPIKKAQTSTTEAEIKLAVSWPEIEPFEAPIFIDDAIFEFGQPVLTPKPVKRTLISRTKRIFRIKSKR
jgi:hypothetical protein